MSSNFILVVDDDEAIRSFLKMALQEEGYGVVLASNGQEALQRTEEQTFSLIVLDMRMPIMDGWEFLEQFEKHLEGEGKNCKVFMLSSSINPEDIDKSKNYKSVCEFLSKPLTPDKFKELLLSV